MAENATTDRPQTRRDGARTTKWRAAHDGAADKGAADERPPVGERVSASELAEYQAAAAEVQRTMRAVEEARTAAIAAGGVLDYLRARIHARYGIGPGDAINSGDGTITRAAAPAA